MSAKTYKDLCNRYYKNRLNDDNYPDRQGWGPVFYEDHLDPNVDNEEIRNLTGLGLDFPFHVVE